jgi:hypothetical protein
MHAAASTDSRGRQTDPLIARALAHLHTLQVRIRAESMNYEIGIWDT